MDCGINVFKPCSRRRCNISGVLVSHESGSARGHLFSPSEAILALSPPTPRAQSNPAEGTKEPQCLYSLGESVWIAVHERHFKYTILVYRVTI